MSVSVGVIGTGTMGRAIALCVAKGGHTVRMFDTNRDSLSDARRWSKVRLFKWRDKGEMGAEGVFGVQKRLTAVSGIAEMKDCDIVIEAVFEDLEVKRGVLAAVGKVLSEEAVVASNTSTLLIGDLAASSGRPDRFAGLHFFYPAEVNRLVELVKGSETSERTVRTLDKLAASMDKIVIPVGDSPGFIVNRIFVPFLNEAARTAGERHVPPATVDEMAVTRLGMPMGPFALMNTTGVEIAYRSCVNMSRLGKFFEPCIPLKRRHSSGRQWPIAGLDGGTPSAPLWTVEGMRAVIFLMSLQLLEEGVAGMDDIDMAVRTGLKWEKGPFEWMREFGQERAMAIVKAYVDNNEELEPKLPSLDTWERAFSKEG